MLSNVFIIESQPSMSLVNMADIMAGVDGWPAVFHCCTRSQIYILSKDTIVSSIGVTRIHKSVGSIPKEPMEPFFCYFWNGDSTKFNTNSQLWLQYQNFQAIPIFVLKIGTNQYATETIPNSELPSNFNTGTQNTVGLQSGTK